jgi:hypothetical protein
MVVAVLLGLMSTVQADEVPKITSVTRDFDCGPDQQIGIEALLTDFDNSKHKVVLRWRRNFEREQEVDMVRVGSSGKHKASIGAWAAQKDQMIRWFVIVQDKQSNNTQLARHPKVKNEKDERNDDSPRYEIRGRKYARRKDELAIALVCFSIYRGKSI